MATGIRKWFVLHMRHDGYHRIIEWFGLEGNLKIT